MHARSVIFLQILEPNFVRLSIVISLSKDSAQKMLYTSIIKTVASIFVNDSGSYINETTLAQDTLDVVNFEIELAKVVFEILIFRLILFLLLAIFLFLSRYFANPCIFISLKVFATSTKWFIFSLLNSFTEAKAILIYWM